MAVEIKEIIKDALMLHQNGDLIGAEKMYLAALGVSPKNTDALNLLGLLKIQNKEFEHAIFYLKRAIYLKPCSYFYENIGIAYFHCKIFEEAINSYKKAIELSPDDFDIWFHLGLAYKNNKQLIKAMEDNHYKDKYLIRKNYIHHMYFSRHFLCENNLNHIRSNFSHL